MDFSRVIEMLGAIKHRGIYHRFRCPCHEDSRPSAEVWEKGGKILFGCWVCCNKGTSPEVRKAYVARVMAHAGLTWKDVMPGDPPAFQAHPGRVVATYVYRDAAGRPLYRKLRREPGRDGRKKDFSMERREGDRWVGGMADAIRVLYRLPELLRDRDSWVTLVGGEKDAENGVRLGLLTTCNPEGEGQWQEYATLQLARRRVVIFPDNDAPGWRHAGEVSYRLRGAGCRVKLLAPGGLPLKGDLTDWIAMSPGTREEKAQAFREMVDATAEWGPIV